MKLELRALLLAAAAAVGCGGGSAPRASAPAPTPARQVAVRDTSVVAAARDSITALDSAEIARLASQVFGGLPEANDATGDSAHAPMWDIDVRSFETNRTVSRYVELFGTSARDRFANRLSRGTRYEPMIRRKLRAGGLPEDMYYLALVESGFDPNAYSRAAAVGMWQFMTTTARGVGMRVDWWVDDRRDPARSTDGAVKFLGWLRDQFGSLYLAAAAYNGGPGRVSRGLTRFAEDLEGSSGDDAFFALADNDYLRAETKNYVPQIIAAAIVAKQPARYGLRVDTLPEYAYDSALVPASTPLAAVARAAGVPLAQIVELNARVLRGVTPPETRFVVRLPAGRGVGFDSALASLGEDERSAFRRRVTKKGESLASIAADEGFSARQLSWYNRGAKTLKSGRLSPGQTLLVPSRDVVAAAVDVPDPAIEIYGRSASTAGAPKVHTVRRGESLGSIANKYGTSVASLVRLNRLKKKVIYPGQSIVVKGGAGRATRVAAASREARGDRPNSKASAGGSKARRVSLSTVARTGGAKKSGVKKSSVKKGAASKASTKKSVAKKASARKGAATKSATAKKGTVSKKSAAAKKSASAAKSTAKRSTGG